MPKIGRHSRQEAIGTGKSGKLWGTGIRYLSKTIPRFALYKGFASQNGPVTITKPADPEKLAAYRQQKRHREEQRRIRGNINGDTDV